MPVFLLCSLSTLITIISTTTSSGRNYEASPEALHRFPLHVGNGVAIGVPCDLLYEGIPRTAAPRSVRTNLAPLKARQWIPLAVSLCGLPEEPIYTHRTAFRDYALALGPGLRQNLIYPLYPLEER